MFEATPKAAPKKKAHESMYDLVKSMRFPGRMLDGERRELGELLAMNCIVRKDDLIPDEIIEPLCHDLLQVAVTTGNVISDEIWGFIVSQMDGEELAIMLLDEICVGLEEGWLIVEHPSGKHIAMTTALYDETVGRAYKEVNEVLGVRSSFGGLIGNLLGHLGIGGRQELLPDPIIARVGPQPEETSSACGCVCAECEARAAGCPIPEAIREAGGCGREIPGAGIPGFDELEPPDLDMMDTAEGRVATGDPEPPVGQDSGQPETPAEDEEPPVAAPSGAPMPIPEAPETPAEVEEPPVAETGDTPAEKSEEAVPAASD